MEDPTRGEFVPVIGNVRWVFAEGFEGIDNKVDAVVSAVLVAAADQMLTH